MSKVGRAAATLFLAVVATTLPISASAEAPVINHDAVGCIVVDKFPRLEARFDPEANVSRGRLRFRPTGGAHWYSVPMKKEAEAFVGVLPKPTPKLKSLDYYVEVTATDFATGRTQEYVPEVVSGLGACQGDKITAGSLGSASIILEVPPGAPAVPAGFSSVGIVSATAAATAAVAGVAAAGGGGLSTTAVVVGGLAVAGGAAAAVAATREAKDEGPADLTAQWTGTFFENDAFGQCTANWRLTMNLVETGGSITSGDLRLDGISSTASPVYGDGAGGVGRCQGSPGDVFAGPLANGSLSGNMVRLDFALNYNPIPPNFPGFNWVLQGTVSSDKRSMTGTWADPPYESGTWTATRQ